jgi:hypothetical protein
MFPLLNAHAQNEKTKPAIKVDSAQKSEGAKADVYVMDKKIIYDPALIKEEQNGTVIHPAIQRKKTFKKKHKKKAVKKPK